MFKFYLMLLTLVPGQDYGPVPVDSGSAHWYVNLNQIENKIEKNVKMIFFVMKKVIFCNWSLLIITLLFYSYPSWLPLTTNDISFRFFSWFSVINEPLETLHNINKCNNLWSEEKLWKNDLNIKQFQSKSPTRTWTIPFEGLALHPVLPYLFPVNHSKNRKNLLVK